MFTSDFRRLQNVWLPRFTGLRVLHMPIHHGNPATWPEMIHGYATMLRYFAVEFPQYRNEVVYLTIDEKVVKKGESHRRPGLHVDGWNVTESGETGGSWGGGDGGSWGGAGTTGKPGTGFLTVSSLPGCRAWRQSFTIDPNPEGECEHLRDQLEGSGEILEPRTAYWLSPLCVHESLPMTEDSQRQFIRLSLPSKADWYEGCTVNPMGVRPAGAIKPQRRFLLMNV